MRYGFRRGQKVDMGYEFRAEWAQGGSVGENMKMSIVSEKENPYMERREIAVKITHDKNATPSKAVVQAEIAKEMKKDSENVQILSIHSENGIGISTGKAYVWKEKKVEDLSKPKPAEEKKE